MEIVKYILIALEALTSIALVAVVLMQSGKEAGLGALAGNADTYMGKNKTNSLDKIAAASTKWIALAWIVLTLALNIV
ncbi:MAG: preprotein translocase subunit SecG [Oscillospiraceae bacterium]|nr:preprotein translocase subunit SecG [Oscillospiraceae bacterium]